ncbi:MAG: Gfo/Idh/MocA family oxidoreductase [Planctomycetes bacterium]|nr:Gfo/Idh/MocA family oxidoreductase [Planctomycetota bacterium]
MMNPWRIGIIGGGWMSGVHAQAFKSLPNAQVTAICSRTAATAERFAKTYDVPRRFTDLRTFLKCAEVDVVVVVTPNHLHHAQGIAALRAGKHVIIEKPLCLTLAQADDLAAAAKSAGLGLAYAEELCFVPKFARAKELADKGAVGRVYEIRQEEKHAGPYSPWFWTPKEAGGGITMDMGCHAIEFIRWAAGKAPITSVSAHMDTVLHRDKTKMEDYAIIHLEFENGILGIAESSWALKGGMESVARITGTEGVVHADLLRGMGLRMYSENGVAGIDGSRGWSFPDYAWLWENGYPQENAHFLDCFDRGVAPSENARDGRDVLEIMLAAYASAAEGRAVRLPFRPPRGLKRPVDLWLRRRKHR